MSGIQGIEYRETKVSQVLRRHDFIDNWFPMRYSLNPYSGCEYGCRYCRVNWKLKSAFKKGVPKTVIIKENASEVLSRELPKITQPQVIGVGGGYNDIFAPINRTRKLSDQIIINLLQAGHRPLLMTKNPGYAMEIMDSWMAFPVKQRPILITSLSTPMESQSFRVEIGPPSPRERLSALAKLSVAFKVGVAFLPWLEGQSINHGLTDLLNEGKKSGWSFTLLSFLKETIPGWSSLTPPGKKEIGKIQEEYLAHSQTLSLWPRLPPHEFSGFLTLKDELTVLLAYSHYLGRNRKKNTFRLASLGVNRLTEMEFQKLFLSDRLEKIAGVGPVISQVIRDFLRYRKVDYFTEIWKKFGYPTQFE